MRIKIRKMILDSLNMMKDAQKIAADMLLKGQMMDAGNLLAQCQQSAQEVGESIEQREGEGTRAVSCLEEYCEVLYHMSQNTDQERISAHHEQLNRILQQVEYEVKEHLPVDRLKVVFLPYKASMWDCMESVWEAADADPECEALVVPIPYYERNAQGHVVKECYEGDMFPKDVPITHYREYHLEKEQPDIAYIHNPYDGGNTVTTVHPDYYSSNLKEYVDQLVYIPYYILGNGPLPDCHLSLPAYEHVDKIIVQDEEKVENLADFVPREKIVALGTPKVDRIRKLDSRKEEILEKEIPQEWRDKIRGKKVILYNVSVTGLLRNSKYAMDKIRYVLSCFEGQDDVMLWWRPHPLLEATLQSTFPQLYGEYMDIKSAFARSGNGILDETGDAGVAAVIADAYLGENSSSLVHYFGVLGKPVMYTRWEITENNRKERDFLAFNTWYQESDSIFFIPVNIDMGHDLYRMGLKNGDIEKVMSFPGMPAHMWGCYYGIRRIKNKIFFAPHNAEDIYVYDMEKKQGIRLVLSESCDRMMLFDEMIAYKEKLFLLPRCYPAIVSVKTESLEICEYKECVKPFLRENETEQMFHWAFFTKGKYLYLASVYESRILIFDMEDGSYTIHEIGTYSYGYCRLLYDGKYFWLAAFQKNCIVRWEEATGNTQEHIYPMEQEVSDMNLCYSSLLDQGDEIIVCCAFSHCILRLHKDTGIFTKYEEVQEILDRMDMNSVKSEAGFGYVKPLDSETALLFDNGSSCVHMWEIETNQWKSFPCRVPRGEMLRIEKRQFEKYAISRQIPYCLWEHAVSIEQFIDYITGGDTDLFKQTYECYQEKTYDLTAGVMIHKYVKGEQS